MIRFIVERHEMDYEAGFERRDFRTLDIDLPQLEKLLRRGGRYHGGYESWRLLGVEIIDAHAADPGSTT